MAVKKTKMFYIETYDGMQYSVIADSMEEALDIFREYANKNLSNYGIQRLAESTKCLYRTTKTITVEV